MFTKITQENIKTVLDSMKDQDVVFDTETTSKDPLKAKLVHVQIGSLVGTEVYWADGPFLFQVMESLILNSKSLIAHHCVYDAKVSYWGLFEPNEAILEIFTKKLYDTKIGLKLLDENCEASLDSFVQANYQDDYKEVFWSRNKNYHEAPIDEAVEYAGKDIVYTRLLYKYIQSHPETIPALLDHVQEFNRRLVRTSVGGLLLDRDYLMGLGVELQASILQSRKDLDQAAKHGTDLVCMDLWVKAAASVKTPAAKARKTKPEFNWSSSTQVKSLLYGKLKLPIQKSYKTKEISVDDEALEKLQDLHPVAALLREYRTYDKMYTSFVEGIIAQSRKVGDNYLVHPEFNPVGTVTLRVGCSGPNYQQLPADKTWGKLRGMLIPPPGYKIITADYSSLEIYLAAAISKDPTLLEICKKGLSFHDATLEGMKDFKGVTRDMCKTMNFAILYGATEFRVAKVTKTSTNTAKDILAAFWNKYPGIKTTIDECHAKVDQSLPIETVYGNKRRPNGDNVDGAKRQAFNFLIQSTGAGLTNRALVSADDKLRALGIGWCAFNVHDELLAIVKEGHEAEGSQILKHCMENEAKKINLCIDLIANPSPARSRWTK